MEIESKRDTPTVVLDLEGNELGWFDTASKAAIFTKVPIKGVLDVLSGRLLKSHEHVFVEEGKYKQFKEKFPQGKMTHASLKRKKNLYLNKK